MGFLLALDLGHLNVSFIEYIMAVFQPHVSALTLDRKHALKDFFEALHLRSLACQLTIPLQKLLIRGKLHIHEVGQIHNLGGLRPDCDSLNLFPVIQHSSPSQHMVGLPSLFQRIHRKSTPALRHLAGVPYAA